MDMPSTDPWKLGFIKSKVESWLATTPLTLIKVPLFSPSLPSQSQVDAVSYITTGSRVPEGANAVVKVEDTKRENEGLVMIKVDVKKGENVRLVGSDIRFSFLLLPLTT
jgi:hypothetical protein